MKTVLTALAFTAAVVLALPAHSATLRVGRNQIPPSLGNPYTSGGQPGAGVWSAIFDGLVVVQRDGTLAPGLARSWELVNPRRWRFRLRPDVTFHNGRPFTAEAAVRNIQALQTEAGKRLYMAAEVAGITAAVAPDPLTLEIETKAPDAILPKRLAAVMMVEPDLWAADESAFALKPVGTGPWQLVDWGRSTGRAVLTPFQKSWRAPAHLDRLEIVVLPEAPTRVTALLSGQIDLAEGFSPDDLALLEGQPFVPVTERGTQVMAIALRNVGNDGAPLQDMRVRQALNYAVNREEIVQAILLGKSRPAAQGCTDMVFGCNPRLAPYPYDPERARALLREAGYAGGFPLRIEVLTGFGSSDQLIYQRVAEQLGQIGVRVTLDTPSYATWLNKYLSGQWGKTDAFSLFWDSSSYHDVIRVLKYYSCDKANPFFCDESVMPKLLASDGIMDPAARRAALEDILADYHRLAPSLWLVEIPYHFAMSRDLEHFAVRSLGVAYEQIGFKAGTRK